MADTSYIRELIMMEKGKPTELKNYLVSKDENRTLARAYLSSHQQGLTSGTSPIVSLDTEDWDIGSNFASYRYVAPVTGYYHAAFSVLLYSATEKIQIAQSGIFKNGTEEARGTMYAKTSGNLGYFNSPGAADVYLTQGQYLDLRGHVTTSDASDFWFHAGRQLTFMSVHLIST